MNSAAHGIDFSEKTSLRLPLKMAEKGNNFEQALKKVKKNTLNLPFLALATLLTSVPSLTDSAGVSIYNALPDKPLIEYRMPVEGKEYTGTSTITDIIEPIIFNSNYFPGPPGNDLIKAIAESFEDIGFKHLLKEAEAIKKSNNKALQNDFLKKIYTLIRERSQISNKFRDTLWMIVESIYAEKISFDIKNTGFKNIDFLRQCGAESHYAIILLRALGFDAKGGLMYEHFLVLVDSLIDGESIFLDTSLGVFQVLNRKEKFDELPYNYIALNPKYSGGKSLREMIAPQKKMFAFETGRVVSQGELTYLDVNPYLIYCYLQIKENCGAASAILCNLAYLNMESETKDYEKAKKLLCRSIDIDPDHAAAYLLLAIIHSEIMSNHDEAIRLCKIAMDIDPNNVLAYYLLGSCYSAKKDYEKAITIYEEGRDMDPNNALNIHKLAAAYYMAARKAKDNNITKAIKYCEEVMKIDSESLEIYELLGELFKKAGEPEKAIAIYEKGVKENKHLTLRHELIKLYAKKRDYKNLLKTCKKIVKVDPRNASAHYYIWLSYEKTGKHKKAGKFYDKAFNLDPELINSLQKQKTSL